MSDLRRQLASKQVSKALEAPKWARSEERQHFEGKQAESIKDWQIWAGRVRLILQSRIERKVGIIRAWCHRNQAAKFRISSISRVQAKIHRKPQPVGRPSDLMALSTTKGKVRHLSRTKEAQKLRRVRRTPGLRLMELA